MLKPTHPQSAYLQVHEWLAIIVMMSILLVLTLVTTFSSKIEKKNDPHLWSKEKEGIEVLIKGAVMHPGVYRFASPMEMRTLLALAKTKPEADLRRFKLESLFKKGRVINVPERVMITVYLKGLTSSLHEVTVPKGTKMHELSNVVELPHDTDLIKLQKKRLLKANEVIEINLKK